MTQRRTPVAELDDARLRSTMRAYLDACDALDKESIDGVGESSREYIERADNKTLAEMVLRQQLQRLGWTAPRQVEPADQD
jgi:hypothetical protein